jgi:GNAT superfamily N-acetyltransferase
MTAQGLELRPTGTTPALLAAYSDLLSRVFGPQAKFSTRALGWLYRDNPVGAVVGMDAWAGDRLAAHYVTIPMRARVRGARVEGLLSLNTATDPDFQGKGLFTRLAKETYEAATARGFQFVTGFANANSTPGFIRKLAFQNVGRLQAGVLLVPPNALPAIPTDFEAAWSEESLAWRLANPASRYAVARRGAVLDIRTPTSVPLLRCAAFLKTDFELQARKASPLTPPPLFIGLEPRVALERRGFIPVPDALRPSPLNMIWRALGQEQPAELDPAAIVISFLDFDPY